MAVNQPNQAFDDCWKAILSSEGECGLQQTFGVFPGDPRYLKMLKEGVKNLGRLFSQREQLQRRIFEALKRDLPEWCDLLDLLSGDMPAVLPLLKVGHLNVVTALDNGIKSPLCNKAGEVAAIKTGLSNRIRRLAVTIDHGTDPSRLPGIENVTLIDTGLAVPDGNRGNRSDDPSPATLRVCHILDPEADFNDVLRVLGGTSRRRVLHVFDAPSYKRPLKAAEMRDFVQGHVDSHPEWKISNWEPVISQSPMMHGTLVLE